MIICMIIYVGLFCYMDEDNMSEDNKCISKKKKKCNAFSEFERLDTQ